MPSRSDRSATRARTRDLTGNATFMDAVTTLGLSSTPLSIVTDYATGANYMMAADALQYFTTIAEHFPARLGLGDPPGFGGAFHTASAAELAQAEVLLRAIDDTTSQALLGELGAWRRQAINRGYLQTFGRFVERTDGERRRRSDRVLEGHFDVLADVG